MDIPLAEAFRFCPRCGQEVDAPGQNPLACEACGFRHHFTPVAGVVAIIADERGRVLLLRRARDPGKGLYGLPGGFVDPGESVDETLAREVHEEVGLTVRRTSYVGSFANPYHYRGVIVPVVDVVFSCEVADLDRLRIDEEEVAGFEFAHPDASMLAQMAFESNRLGLALYLRTRHAQ
jgi:ADP-ribose pyrophosphatase